MKSHTKSMEKKFRTKSYLHTCADRTWDGEYVMDGVTMNPKDLIDRITKKAKKTLNPKKLPMVQFNDEWIFYKDRSKIEIMKDEFLTDGGTFEYISWSDYAGGNRLEVSGGCTEEDRKWAFIGRGRLS